MLRHAFVSVGSMHLSRLDKKDKLHRPKAHGVTPRVCFRKLLTLIALDRRRIA